jgi:hypothetical protein
MAVDLQTRKRLHHIWSQLERRGLREPADSVQVQLQIDHSNDSPRPVLHEALVPMRTEFPGTVLRRRDLNERLLQLIC